MSDDVRAGFVDENLLVVHRLWSTRRWYTERNAYLRSAHHPELEIVASSHLYLFATTVYGHVKHQKLESQLHSHGIILKFCINCFETDDNIYILVDCESHGTHVAGIVAANFQDSPHFNGMDP